MEIKIEEYLLLVRKTVKKYKNVSKSLGIDDEDLFQEGCLGLIEAKNNYKSELNIPFSKYAIYWIRKYILKSIKNIKS